MPKRIIPVRSWSIVGGFIVLTVLVGSAALVVELQESSDLTIRQNLLVQAALAKVQTVVQDAESGQRGYLLTGDKQYLDPYQEAVASVDVALAELQAVADHIPSFRFDLGQLFDLIAAKMDEMRTTIARHQAGDQVGALAIIQGDSGEALGQQIRKVIKTVRAEQEQVLRDELSDATDLANLLRVVIVLSAIFIVSLAVFTIRQIYRRAEIIVRQRDELEVANQELLLEKSTREAAESQVRQMQKMEAMGQLTGGVAHDFNNMLAVIMSSFELLENRLAKGNVNIQRFIDSGMDAAQRAATLTQRLLAFSRQQTLAPSGLDANHLVGDMSDLLRRTLGTDVVVESVLGVDLWHIHADRGQLENAIVNLCVNARDAMPDGGKLTIETANIHLDEKYAREHPDIDAGDYVLIAISDNGCGMEPDVVRRAFDPFFTTKAVGRGTGLGLSQVYGFVRQSGGHIDIYSEVGEGTSVKIYLPRYSGPLEEREPAENRQPLPKGSKSEVILLVEDEERVRELSVTALAELGYTVIAAGGADEALQLLDENPDVDLLLTDIVMPEINGRKLVEEAVRQRPDLRTLYMTGFTRNAVVHGSILDEGANLIQKPFTLEDLANKVREVLDTPPDSKDEGT